MTAREWAHVVATVAGSPARTFTAPQIARLMRAAGATHRARVGLTTIYARPSLTRPGRAAWCPVTYRGAGRYVPDGWVVVGDGRTLTHAIPLAGGRP